MGLPSARISRRRGHSRCHVGELGDALRQLGFVRSRRWRGERAASARFGIAPSLSPRPQLHLNKVTKYLRITFPLARRDGAGLHRGCSAPLEFESSCRPSRRRTHGSRPSPSAMRATLSIETLRSDRSTELV